MGEGDYRVRFRGTQVVTYFMQTNDMEKLILEKKDAEQFLSLIAPKYMGVYVLDADTDYFRDVIGPSYFRRMVQDRGGRFSAAMEIYRDELVQEDYQYRISRMLNYDYVQRQLAEKGSSRPITARRTVSW